MKRLFLLRLAFVSIISVVLMGINSCQKADLSEIENLRNNKIGVIGHGGAGFPSTEVNLPSNSLEGITKAVEGYGTEGVEVDVQLSKDGILFLYHDSRLQTLTDCVGCLHQYEAEELDDCKYVLGFNTQNFNNQKLVRLETIIKRFSSRTSKPYIFLDLKTSPDCPHSFDYSNFETAYIESLKAIFEKYNCQDWVIVESADFSFLKKLQAEIDELQISYFTLISESSIEQAVEHNFFGLSSNFGSASKATIKAAHEQGLFVTLGILKIRRDAIDMIEMSPDFIYTDNILLLQSILD